MKRLPVVLLALALLPAPSFAGERGARDYYGSSLLAWVDAVALALEDRAREGDASSVVLEVRGGRGVADRKAARVFQPRLAARLAEGGRLAPGDRGLVARIELSLDGGLLWAVGLLEGGGLPGPAAFAVSWPVDRELEAVLAATPSRTGQARWAMERLGTVPAGVLDVMLLDLDGDRADEIVLLSVDGVRTLRFASGEPRPELLGGPWALAGGGDWPRVVGGWLAISGDGRIRIGTTAGHAAELEPTSGRWLRGATGVPLRQPGDPGRDPLLLARLVDGGPLLDVAGQGDGLPRQVRDLARLPGARSGWVWVAPDGTLAGLSPEGTSASLPEGRVGDRVVVADLDGDRQPDLVTTDASGPTEPDHVTIHRLDPDLAGHGVLFRAAVDGGAVVAMAVGDLDFDGRTDLLVVEEGSGEEAVLWRVERTR